MQTPKWLIRLSHWEYWNGYLITLPLLPYLLYLFIKARNCFFFNAANPGIAYGGFLMESKWDIHKSYPNAAFPVTVKVNTAIAAPLAGTLPFTFPMIAKPDIGSQGRAVCILNNQAELDLYHQQCPVDYILQEKVTLPLEAGIFFVKMPGEANGIITGIVEKHFITVTGDGHTTVEALLRQNKRYLLQLSALLRLLQQGVLQHVPAAGTNYTVLDIGNHAKGAMFTDASYRINSQLTASINELCNKLPGFYFGRLDIRFENWELLQQGQQYCIIEVNGAGSEPTHMYDPAHSLWHAWKEIAWHWQLMYRVSKHNHQNGVPYLTWQQGIRMFRDNAKVNKQLSQFSFTPHKQGLHTKVINLYEQIPANSNSGLLR